MPGLEEVVLRAVPSGSRVVRHSRLRSLWAGYGSISEVLVELPTDGASRGRKGNRRGRAENMRMIVKRVQAPRDSGVGHERKLRSYVNEGFFYRELAFPLLDEGVGVPEPLLVEGDGAGLLTLVMKDQREEYPSAGGDLTLEQAKAALSWLAAFHAHFWGRPTPEGLWRQGTFWYLDTRQEEFQAMEWRALAATAEKIDTYLKGERDEGVQDHMTVVHGDFKEENILFSADGRRCAAHDFQYCGRGLGAKDVAYLFCSGLDSALLPAREAELLGHYHAELMARLSPRGMGATYTVEVLHVHLDYALADFVRFMDGWGYWGNNRWARTKVEAFLKRLE